MKRNFSNYKLVFDIDDTAKCKIKSNRSSYFNSIKERANDYFDKIAPTTFPVEYIKGKDKSQEYYDEKGKSVILNQEGKLRREPFGLISVNLFDYVLDFTATELKILLYINKTIKPNTNIYSFDIDDLANKLNTTNGAVRKAISEFIGYKTKDIILKTNCNNVYIINHNKIFKGDFDNFVTHYHELYKDTVVGYDDKGRIVIKSINK